MTIYSRGKRNDHMVRDGLAMLDPICNYPESQRLYGSESEFARAAVYHYARKLRDVCYPAAIGLAGELDLEIEGLWLAAPWHMSIMRQLPHDGNYRSTSVRGVARHLPAPLSRSGGGAQRHDG